MTMNRHRIDLADTGTVEKIFKPVFGEIAQVRWHPDTDTGASLTCTVLPNTDDTGDGWDFIRLADTGLESQFTKVPVQAGHDIAGAAVSQYFPTVLAGDRIRVRTVAKGTAAITGQLYFYVKEI